MRLIACVVMLGCSGRAAPPVVSSPAPGEPVPPNVDGYDLPAIVPPPAYDVVCVDFPEPEELDEYYRPKIRKYDFAPVALTPDDADGPRLADRTRRGSARTPLNLYDAVRYRWDGIQACWSWGSWGTPSPADTTVKVAFDVDPWGEVSAVVATAPDASAELLTCLEAAVTGSLARGTTTRPTHATATFELKVADRQVSKKRPRKPKAPPRDPPSSGHRCAPILRDAVADEVTVDATVDRARETCERVPPHDADKREIRRAMKSNTGVFGSCYVEARQRDPQLTGDVVVKFSLRRHAATVTELEGAGDEAFHVCLRAGVEDQWIPQALAVPIDVVWTWTLTESPPPLTTEDPYERLEAGDFRGALAIWEAWLSDDPHGTDACEWRAGVLTALSRELPWLDDPRLDAAFADLLADAAGREPEVARACLAAEVLGLMLPRDRTYMFRARERLAMLELMLPVADLLPDNDRLPRGDDLRAQRAFGLGMYDRAAGHAAWLELAASATSQEQRERAEQQAAQVLAGRSIDPSPCPRF